MNCKDVIDLVDAYVDRELDPITNKNIERHLRECGDCGRVFKDHQALVGAIGAAAPYHKPPADLRERIQASLRDEMAESALKTVPEDQPERTRKRQPWWALPFEPPWNWLGLAAAALVAALVVWSLETGSRRAGSEPLLATQLIASHVRSLMVDHLTDVASTDQHTVKPWFEGKLDFAPSVANPASDGFPLVGGRLDYLDNRPVAALVYQRRKHFINVFIWPLQTGESRTTEATTRQGYQLLHWVDGDLNYWAVSDINDRELAALKELIEKQTTPQP